MSNLFTASVSSGADGDSATTSNVPCTFVSGTAPKVSTVRAVDGTRSLLVNTSGTNSYCYWNHASCSAAVYDLWLWLDATPTGNVQLAYIAKQSDGLNLADLRVQPTGKLQVRNNFVSEWVSSTVLAAGKWWHLRWMPGSASGKQRVLIFDGNSGTATEDTDNLAAASRPDYTGGAFDRFHAGVTATATQKLWLDRINGDTTTGIGGVATAPTVDAGGPWGIQDTHSASIDATVTGNTGTTTYAWSVLTGPSTSSAQFSTTTALDTTFTPAGGAGTYTLQLSVTDDSGVTTDTTTVVVTALTSDCSVVAVTTSAGWTATGGASSVLDALQGTGYLVSSSNPSSLDLDYTMSGMLPPGSGVDYVHTVPCRRNGGTSGTFDASLRKLDGTLVKKVTATTLPSGATRDPTTVTFLAADITGMTTADWNAGHRVLLEETAS